MCKRLMAVFLCKVMGKSFNNRTYIRLNLNDDRPKLMSEIHVRICANQIRAKADDHLSSICYQVNIKLP